MKVILRRAVVAVAVIALWLVPASTADAVIQVQRGISGIALGMSPARVKAGLGMPAKVKTGSNDFGPFTQYLYRGGITVTFQGNANVTAITITGPTDRTARGVGVGSTETAVKARVSGVKCETTGGVRSCHVGAFLPGHRVTDFVIRNGRVSRVTVGFVID
jgi:hypothetical protein